MSGKELGSDAMMNAGGPGGLNSAFGERLDNMFGGNPNPPFGAMPDNQSNDQDFDTGFSEGYNYGNGYSYNEWQYQ